MLKQNEAPSRTLADAAYAKISHAIITGRYHPGEKLTLRGLQEMLDMSSTPIRDAIAKLASEQALDFEPNRHIRLPVLTPDELRELRDIRVALEGQAAELAARRIDADGLARLHDLDREIRARRDAGDIPETIATIQRLHFALYDLSGRRHLVRLIAGQWLRSAPYIRHIFPDYSAKERGRLRAMLFEALAAGEFGSARAFLEADVRGAMDHIIAERTRLTGADAAST